MTAPSPIGLYDSGIGGLSVFREVSRQLPEESMVYFGDTARVPYGPRKPAEIVRFSQEIVHLLRQQDVKLIVIACNTSSALALPVLRRSCPVPILGMIDPGARAALRAGRRIGVIATEGTVRSGAYGRALRRLDARAEVVELACPRFVPLVEGGCWQGEPARTVVRESLASLRDQNLDALILGCTHYPHLAPLIREVMGEGVRLVDPAEQVVATARALLANRGMMAPEGSTAAHRVFTSGDPEPFYHLARRLLPGAVGRVEQVIPTLPHHAATGTL